MGVLSYGHLIKTLSLGALRTTLIPNKRKDFDYKGGDLFVQPLSVKISAKNNAERELLLIMASAPKTAFLFCFTASLTLGLAAPDSFAQNRGQSSRSMQPVVLMPNMNAEPKRDDRNVMKSERAITEQARQMLQRQLEDEGYPFTPETFVNTAREGNLRIVQRFLDAGMRANVSLPGGYSALMMAAQNGQHDMTFELIQNGANIDAINTRGETPLNLAIANNNLAVARTLLEAGASVERADLNGWRPLHYAADMGNVQAIDMLLDIGAVVDPRNKLSATPLMLAIYKGHDEAFEKLIQRGAGIEVRSIDGATPLFHAIEHGRYDIVERLIELGARFDVRNNTGIEAIEMALINGDLEIANLLYAKGIIPPDAREPAIGLVEN